MWLAAGGVIRAHWTNEIHREWMRNVARDFGVALGVLTRVQQLMDRAAGDALIRRYRHFERLFRRRTPKIVTSRLRHWRHVSAQEWIRSLSSPGTSRISIAESYKPPDLRLRIPMLCCVDCSAVPQWRLRLRLRACATTFGTRPRPPASVLIRLLHKGLDDLREQSSHKLSIKPSTLKTPRTIMGQRRISSVAHAAIFSSGGLIKRSAGMPSCLCSRQIMRKVSGRLRFSTS